MKEDKILEAYEKMLKGKVEEEKDADAAYKNKYDSILKTLDEIKNILKKHSVKQAKSPNDWGFTGEINDLDNELKLLIKSFK
jgi:hypothetical protein